MAARTVPEVATTTFDCDGFRSCSVTAEGYVPTGAVLVSAEVALLTTPYILHPTPYTLNPTP